MAMSGLNRAISGNPIKQNSGAEKAGQGSVNTNFAITPFGQTPRGTSSPQISGEHKKLNLPLADPMRGDGELHRKTGDTVIYPLVSGLSQNLYGQWVDVSGVAQMLPVTGVSYQIVSGSGDNAALTGRQGTQDFQYKVGNTQVTKKVSLRTQ